MKDQFKEAMGALVISLTTIVIGIAYGVLTSGLLLYKFWSWFVTSVFPSLPVLMFSQAVGLAVFLNLIGKGQSQLIKKEYVDPDSNTAKWLLPWIVLLVGYIVHLFIK